jgi:hypothetical protein
MNDASFDVDAVAAAYRKATQFKKQLNDQIDAVDRDLVTLKDMLFNYMSNHNTTSLTTTAGDRMHLRTSTRYSSNDWAHFKAWVITNPDAIDLFEHRLHQGNVKQWLEDNQGETTLVPPGLSSHTTTTVVITPAKGE